MTGARSATQSSSIQQIGGLRPGVRRLLSSKKSAMRSRGERVIDRWFIVDGLGQTTADPNLATGIAAAASNAAYSQMWHYANYGVPAAEIKALADEYGKRCAGSGTLASSPPGNCAIYLAVSEGRPKLDQRVNEIAQASAMQQRSAEVQRDLATAQAEALKRGLTAGTISSEQYVNPNAAAEAKEQAEQMLSPAQILQLAQTLNQRQQPQPGGPSSIVPIVAVVAAIAIALLLLVPKRRGK